MVFRKIVSVALAACMAAGVMAAKPKHAMTPMKPMRPAMKSGTAVKGYTRTLKSGKKVEVKGYTRKPSGEMDKGKMVGVKGYTRTTKSGKVIHVKPHMRKAPKKMGATHTMTKGGMMSMKGKMTPKKK